MPYLIKYSISNLDGSYLLTTGPFDANNQDFTITLDATIIKRPGRYVLIKAPSMTNYTSVKVTVNFDSPSTLRSRRVTLGEPVLFPDGVTYSCCVVDLI